MPIRSESDLLKSPCLYKLKDFERNVQNSNNVITNKIKQQVPKLDENGNIIYKTVLIPVKSGCGCKGKPQTTTMKEQKVPEMVDTWVDIPVGQQNANQDTKFAICKLYGTVKRSICENCKTYKKK
jgi:hypothetical protein